MARTLRCQAVRKVVAKKKCCQSRPRCKRCPVVLKRLEAAGFADRVTKREYRVGTTPKKVRKRARKR